MKRLVVILGPTASGKTGWAVKMCKKLDGEIVSADSRQIYRGMDIGTAKERDTNGIAQHLIDIVDPDEEYTLAQYQEAAFGVMSDIQERNKLPFLIGGTGQYISAIVDNWKVPEVAPDKELRGRLEKMSLDELAAELREKDPASYSIVDLKNRRRIMRALEVTEKTGQSFVSLRQKERPAFDVFQIGIKVDRGDLVARIDKRVEAMVRHGLIEEAEALGKKYGWEGSAMSGIGYRQIGAYVRGEMSKGDAMELIKRDTRRYARRQMTWFKRDKRIHWVEQYEQAEKLVKDWIA